MPESCPWISPDDARQLITEGNGRGVKVAVIDSGVEADHPDLEGLTLSDDIAVLRYTTKFRILEDAGTDLFGHGTAVAGIIRKYAPEAEIGSFRVLGEGLTSRVDLVSEGIRQAIKRGYHILNCSFGCRGEDRMLSTCKQWVDDAYLAGVHIVAACNNQDYSVPEWPSHFPSVVSVNMMDCEDEQIFHVPGNLIEFGARGVDLDVVWKGGARKQVMGSSYAAPHVSAAIARLLSKSPGLPPLHLKDLLKQITIHRPASLGFSDF